MNSHDSRPSLVSIYHTSLANCTYINYNQLSYCLETLGSPQLLIVWEIWMPIPPFMTGNSQRLEKGSVFVARRSAKKRAQCRLFPTSATWDQGVHGTSLPIDARAFFEVNVSQSSSTKREGFNPISLRSEYTEHPMWWSQIIKYA